jgi:EAL domain-containing protein (putative c-di-GMP-specific phosphodiesterase class I)
MDPGEEDVARALSHALERDALTLVYQPRVSLKHGRLESVEALTRWQHPEWGAVPPAKFIAVADAAGLAAPLWRWTVKKALAQVGAWWNDGEGVRVALNVTVRQWLQPDLGASLVEAMREAGTAQCLVELDLTEPVLTSDPAVSERNIRELRQHGMRLALDDFGTGASSLGCLVRFPIDAVKIDGSFVRQIGGAERSAKLVQGIVALARSLGIASVAEGVETPEQLEFLMVAGCTEAQGYLLGRPMSPDDLASWRRVYEQSHAAGRRWLEELLATRG